MYNGLTCDQCGAPLPRGNPDALVWSFYPGRKLKAQVADGLYCSESCRMLEHWQRRRARREASNAIQRVGYEESPSHVPSDRDVLLPPGWSRNYRDPLIDPFPTARLDDAPRD